MKQTEQTNNIRSAVPNEAAQILALVFKAFKEDGPDLPSPDIEKISEIIAELIARKSLLVYTDKDLVKGIMFLKVVDSMWWKQEAKKLYSFFFYVVPEYRSKRIAFDLIEVAKQIASLNELDLVIDLSLVKDLDRKGVFCKRAGFEKTGMQYTLFSE